MSPFLIDVELPSELTEEMISIIPEQRKRVDKLMDEGVISTYTLALDRSKLWIVLYATDSDEASDIVDALPLGYYFDYEVFPLAFHNSVANLIPSISLN